MNWTGGKLQRHSKANANRTLKAQKRYFAKAKLRFLSGNGPPSPSSFSVIKRSESSALCTGAARTTSDGEGHRNSNVLPRSHEDDRQNNNPSRTLQQPPLDPQTDALEDLRQKLLQRSDWAGLAATRPAHVGFQSAEEMEQIGRRRKVTKEERRQKAQVLNSLQPHQNIIEPFQREESQSLRPRLRNEDYSIRLGSSIHRTQPTTDRAQQRTQSTVSRSTHAESMLLDKFEATQSPILKAVNPPITPEPRTTQHEVETCLMPLKEARVFKTFDKLLEESSTRCSKAINATDSSTPREQSDTQNHTRRQRSTAENMRRPDTRLLDEVEMMEDSFLLDSQPQIVCQAINPGEIESLGQSRGSVPPSEGLQKRHPSMADHREEIATCGDGIDATVRKPSSDSTHPKHRNPTRPFTIDQQVLLEQQLGSTSPAHAIGDVVFLTMPATYAGRSGSNFGSQVVSKGQSNSLEPSLCLSNSKPPTTGESLEASERSIHRRHQALEAHNSSPPKLRIVMDGAHMLNQDLPQLKWRDRFCHAKKQQQEDITTTAPTIEPWRSFSGDLGDDNEAWMRYVFPKDFERIQNSFTFRQPTPKAAPGVDINPWHRLEHSTFISKHEQLDASHLKDPYTTTVSGSRPVAGATVLGPTAAHASPASQSDTDFVSMPYATEGTTNNRFAHVALYGNPSKIHGSSTFTRRTPIEINDLKANIGSATSQHGVSNKRTAQLAFGESSSLRGHEGAPPWNMQLSHSIKQLRLGNNNLASSDDVALEIQKPSIYQASPDSRMTSSHYSLPKLSKDWRRKMSFPMSYSPTTPLRKTNQDVTKFGRISVNRAAMAWPYTGSEHGFSDHHGADRTSSAQQLPFMQKQNDEPPQGRLHS